MSTPSFLPEVDVARVKRWCAKRVPEEALHQVRVECEVSERYLTVVERRAPWRKEFGPEWTSFPIARLRYIKKDQNWQLYWRDRNLHFHRYDRIQSPTDITALLAELDLDPTGIFWG